MVTVCGRDGVWCVAVMAGIALAGGCATSPAPRALPEPLVAMVLTEGQVADFLACTRGEATLISAHRGGVGPGFPENAIETFAQTLSVMPAVIETDVRQTADGVIVLMHDEELERTTTGEGTVSQTSWAELQALRLVDNDGTVTAFKAPRLEDALAWARGRAILQLDVKRTVDIADVSKAVAEAQAEPYAAVIAYSVEDALRAAEANRDVTVSVEITDLARLDALEAEGVGAARLMAWTGVAEEPLPELWAGLNARGLSAAFGALWYMDADAEESGDDTIYAELADLGADVISTDRHEAAFAALETRQDTAAAVRQCVEER